MKARKAASKSIAYAAFLRGIGPGDPKKSNESLRKVFAALGFINVRSFISSGNILFESPEKNADKLEKIIKKRFQTQLGIEVPAFVRSKAELDAFIAKTPFGKRTHSRTSYLTVTFVKNAAQTALLKDAVKEDVKKGGDKSFRVLAFDAKIQAITGVADTTINRTPEFMIRIEKAFGKNLTTRTMQTIERVAARL